MEQWFAVPKWLLDDWASDRSLVRLLLLPVVFSGLGAFAGGFIGYRFRKREDRFQRSKDRLERMAIASALAAGTCSSALSYKRQLISPTTKKYFESRTRVQSELGLPKTGPKLLQFDLDLIHFSPPALSSSEVLEAVKKLSQGDARNLSQAIALLESGNNFEKLCSERNRWIEKFQEAADKTDPYIKMFVYFGIPVDAERQDARYLHYMEALAESLDSVIFHSFEIYSRLACELVDQSQAFKARYGEDFNFATVNYSQLVADGWFPDRSLFADWLRTPNKHQKSWRQSPRSFADQKKKFIKSDYAP